MTEVLAGRYELGGEIGSGGMARVCEAYDRTLARRVAVKLLHNSTLSQPGMRDRFLREARTAASFSHPNAVAVYDTGREGGVPYIVMELVEGRSLAEVIEDRGALDEREATAVASQILSALAAAHRRGLVHRDVKPANVLLPGGVVPNHPTGDPPAKLADFGIAKGLEQAAVGLTATGQVLGTPKYVSPEQVSGEPATPRSDVYSVGVMLYEMVAGRPPFDGDTAIALALAHRNDPVPRLDRKARGVNPGLAAVVHRALEKDPARRFADAGEMRAALADPSHALAGAGATTVAVDQGATTRTLPAADAEEEPPRSVWRPILLVTMLALALLAVVAVDWGAILDRFTPEPVDEEEPEEPEEPEPPPDDPDPEPEPEAPPEEPPPEEEPEPEEPPEEPDPEEPPEEEPPEEEPPEEEPPPEDEGDGSPGENGASNGGEGPSADGDILEPLEQQGSASEGDTLDAEDSAGHETQRQDAGVDPDGSQAPALRRADVRPEPSPSRS